MSDNLQGTFFTHKRVVLAAGQTQRVAVTGTFFAVTAALAPFRVGLDEGEGFPVQKGFAFQCAGDNYFKSLLISSDAENVIEFYAGRGWVADARANVVSNSFVADGPTVSDVRALPVLTMKSPTQAVTSGAKTLAAGAVLNFVGTGNPVLNQGRRAEFRVFNTDTSGSNKLVVTPKLDTGNQWGKALGPGESMTVETDADFQLQAPSGNSAPVNYVVAQLFFPFDVNNPFSATPISPARFTWAEDFSAYADNAAYPPAGTPNYNLAQIAGAFGTATSVRANVGSVAFKSARFPTHTENTAFNNGSRQRLYLYAQVGFFDLISPRPVRCRFRWKLWTGAANFCATEIGGENTLACWGNAKVSMGPSTGNPVTQLILSAGGTTLDTQSGISFAPSTWYQVEWDHTFGAAADSVFKITPLVGGAPLVYLQAHGVNTGSNAGTSPLGNPGDCFLLTPSGLLNTPDTEANFPALGPLTVEMF